MDIIGIIAAIIFIVGYLLIALEQRFNTHKSAIALVMAGILWILAGIKSYQTEYLTKGLDKTALDVFGIVAFCLASMALIEILAHYRFFDWIRYQLLRLNLRGNNQFVLMIGLTFLLSGVLDNISLTISMIQVARRFFDGKNLLLAVAGIVIASNGGGAWSPIGDVTSILLWMSRKITAWELISMAFLPTATLVGVACFLLYRQLDFSALSEKNASNRKIRYSLSEKVIVSSALFSFVMPLVVNAVGISAYIGRLFGYGLTWSFIEFAKKGSRRLHKTHISANIEKIMRKTDLVSVHFFIGILLSVGALGSIGVLNYVSNVAVGPVPSETWLIFLGSFLGLMSGVIDNSALMAMALLVFPTTDPGIWALIAITTGTGGSLMIFASAAGIVAMGSVKQLNFQEYIKIGTVPAFAGLVAAIFVWFVQYKIF